MKCENEKIPIGFCKKIAYIQTGLTNKSYPVDPVNPVKKCGFDHYRLKKSILIT